MTGVTLTSLDSVMKELYPIDRLERISADARTWIPFLHTPTPGERFVRFLENVLIGAAGDRGLILERSSDKLHYSLESALDEIINRYAHSWTDIEIEAVALGERHGIDEREALRILWSRPRMKDLGYCV